MSSYPKNSDTAIAVDAVEAWLDQFPHKRAENKPNGGIIRSVADTSDLRLREMSPRERKVARAKAQREHKEALKNLAKKEAQDAKKIAKQIAIWKREQRTKSKASEQPKKVKKHNYPSTRKRAKHKAGRALPQIQIESNIRRDELAKQLKAGQLIEMAERSGGTGAGCLYRQQKFDLKKLAQAGLQTVRIASALNRKSYFALNQFEVYQSDVKLKGNFDSKSKRAMQAALATGQMVAADQFTNSTRLVAASMTLLSKLFNLDIYTVYDSKTILGWILLEDKSKEVAYKEFEAIAAGVDATVKQVVAAGNRQ